MCTDFANKVWLDAVKTIINDAGLDAESEFERHGLAELNRNPSGKKIRSRLAGKAWALATDCIDEAAIELYAARAYFNPVMCGSLGLSIMCSSSLLEAMERLVTYSNIFTDVSPFELVERDDSIGLQIIPSEDPEFICNKTVDFGVACFFLMLKSIYPGQLLVNSVYVRGANQTNAKVYQDFFGGGVTFESSEVGVFFDRGIVESVLPTENTELACWQDKFTENYIQQSNLEGLIGLVKQEIKQVIESGAEPNCHRIAETLNISQRSLQRKLKRESATYKELVAEVRKSLALDYLGQPKATLNDTAYRLGFSDHSSFARAFRRWYGLSPTEYQMSLSAE